MLPFHCPQRRLQKGTEGQAQPFQLLQGHGWGWGWWQPCSWAACQAPLLRPAQRYKPGSRLKAGLNRALDSQSNSATLLKRNSTVTTTSVLSLTDTDSVQPLQAKRKCSRKLYV
jgi:hypothetical protein